MSLSTIKTSQNPAAAKIIRTSFSTHVKSVSILPFWQILPFWNLPKFCIAVESEDRFRFEEF